MTHASSDIQLIKPWVDKRTDAKAAAKLATATATRQILWAAAHKSRTEAIELGNPRYTGHPCRHGHGSERDTKDGGCVACAREGAERRRRLRGVAVKGAMPQARHPLSSAKREAARGRTKAMDSPAVRTPKAHSGSLAMRVGTS
jgi:hypothetical protein